MKRLFRWGSTLLGSIYALDAAAVPRPRSGDSASVAGRPAGEVTSAPIWVIVAGIIVMALVIHQVISRRKR